MTDTTTEDPVAGDAEVEPAADATPVVAPKAPRSDALQTRFLIPLLLPVLAIIAVALYALNISRVFLAGDSTSALVIATIITLDDPLRWGTDLGHARRAHVVAGDDDDARARDRGVGRAPRARAEPRHRRRRGSSQLAQPKCTPVSTVSVEALASIKFNSTTFTASGGCVQIDYGGAPGHTLQFRTLDYKGFPLGTDTGKPKSGKVTLKPGTYQIYCTIDSHAAQGMEATITVTAAPPPST